MTDGNGSRLQGLTGEASDVNDDSAKEKEREEVCEKERAGERERERERDERHRQSRSAPLCSETAGKGAE